MSDLITRLRERAADMEFATNLDAEAAGLIEAQAAALIATAEAAATHLKAKMAADAEIARLREALGNIKTEVGRPSGRFNHLKRIVALNCKALEQNPSPDLPSDVVRLIIAARTMALGDWYSESEGYEIARKELDDAAEAFARRVEWPDTPSEQEGGE